MRLKSADMPMWGNSNEGENHFWYVAAFFFQNLSFSQNSQSKKNAFFKKILDMAVFFAIFAAVNALKMNRFCKILSQMLERICMVRRLILIPPPPLCICK